MSVHPTDRCPLCDRANDCQMAAGGVEADACWCSTVRIPATLRDRVPDAQRGTVCICAGCVAEHTAEDSWPNLASVVSARLNRIRCDH